MTSRYTFHPTTYGTVRLDAKFIPHWRGGLEVSIDDSDSFLMNAEENGWLTNEERDLFQKALIVERRYRDEGLHGQGDYLPQIGPSIAGALSVY